MKPPSATSTPDEPFIRKLEQIEWMNAPAGQRRRLNIYAVGGVTQLGDKKGGALLKRLGDLYQSYQAYYTGESEHDLVVPLSSATSANKSGYEATRTNCDHFSYFSDEDCGSEAITQSIRLLWDCFGLTDTIAPYLEPPHSKHSGGDVYGGLSLPKRSREGNPSDQETPQDGGEIDGG